MERANAITLGRMAPALSSARSRTLVLGIALLGACVLLDLHPLVAATAANLGLLLGIYLEHRQAERLSPSRLAHARKRVTQAAAIVLGVALVCAVKAQAPTATQLGHTAHLLLLGALLEGIICVGLTRWLTRPSPPGDHP